MTVAQAATLQVLADRDLRLGEISTRLGITASTMTRNLSRLEDRGFVRRVSDPDDGRAQRICLTESGQQAAREVRLQEEAFARSVLECLPEGSVSATLAGFNRLLAAVRAATESCCPGAYDHLVTGLPRCDNGGNDG